MSQYNDPAAQPRPEQFERNGEEIRADMDRTLHALEQKFSPGQLLDRSIDYVQQHGGRMMRQTSDALRRHPVPAIMAVGGAIWLTTALLATSRSSSSSFSGSYGGTQDATGTEGSTEVGNGTLHGVQDKAKQMLHSTQAKVRQTSEEVTATVRERPLVFGVLALAAGALLGALLPTTPYERRTLSGVRNRAVNKAREFGERQYVRWAHGEQADAEPGSEHNVGGQMRGH